MAGKPHIWFQYGRWRVGRRPRKHASEKARLACSLGSGRTIEDAYESVRMQIRCSPFVAQQVHKLGFYF